MCVNREDCVRYYSTRSQLTELLEVLDSEVGLLLSVFRIRILESGLGFLGVWIQIGIFGSLDPDCNFSSHNPEPHLTIHNPDSDLQHSQNVFFLVLKCFCINNIQS